MQTLPVGVTVAHRSAARTVYIGDGMGGRCNATYRNEASRSGAVVQQWPALPSFGMCRLMECKNRGEAYQELHAHRPRSQGHLMLSVRMLLVKGLQ